MLISKEKKVLVIAAHPDDEILGCGGTLSKLNKLGYKINIIFMSDGVSSRNFIDPQSLKKQIINRQNSALLANKIIVK